MTMQDPIADMLTRIRNGQKIGLKKVEISFSNLNEKILEILVNEGYIAKVSKERVVNSKLYKLIVDLKYYKGKPVISSITRASKPGLRLYSSVNDLPTVLGGLGIAIISTNQGILTDHIARRKRVSGEVLCYVE